MESKKKKEKKKVDLKWKKEKKKLVVIMYPMNNEKELIHKRALLRGANIKKHISARNGRNR